MYSNAMKGGESSVVFENDAIDLDIPIDGVEHEHWSLVPIGYPRVCTEEGMLD